MVSRRSKDIADDVYEPVVTYNVNDLRVRLGLVWFQSRQLVAEQSYEIPGSVGQVHVERIAYIALEQVHPCACVMRCKYSWHFPGRSGVSHIYHIIVRK